MTARGWWLLLLSAGLTVSANLLLRAGLDRAGGFAGSLGEMPSALLDLAGQPLFDLGFILYALAALVWFRVVASGALSTAYPLLISLTFLLITLGAAVWFQESLTLRKLMGLVVILLGVFLLRGQIEARI